MSDQAVHDNNTLQILLYKISMVLSYGLIAGNISEVADDQCLP
jgi:hypothetical protein